MENIIAQFVYEDDEFKFRMSEDIVFFSIDGSGIPGSEITYHISPEKLFELKDELTGFLAHLTVCSGHEEEHFTKEPLKIYPTGEKQSLALCKGCFKKFRKQELQDYPSANPPTWDEADWACRK